MNIKVWKKFARFWFCPQKISGIGSLIRIVGVMTMALIITLGVFGLLATIFFSIMDVFTGIIPGISIDIWHNVDAMVITAFWFIPSGIIAVLLAKSESKIALPEEFIPKIQEIIKRYPKTETRLNHLIQEAKEKDDATNLKAELARFYALEEKEDKYKHISGQAAREKYLAEDIAEEKEKLGI